MAVTLTQLLKTVITHGASDLHLIVGSEPQIRISGKLKPLNMPPINPDAMQQLCYSILTDDQKKEFEEYNELDFAFEMPGSGRFRGNYYVERSFIAAAFRVIPIEIPKMDDFGFPPVMKSLLHNEKGLILVTGPTGSGKSTTMAAMINEVNMTMHKHILTIEDPVEFLHKPDKCMVSQRNVGADTRSFARALKASLRQDPDIIFVGEMRDIETISAAISAAETGHLVMGTLHTNSAVQTLNRIINVFPASEQALIRVQLSMGLLGIISQMLLPKIGGGRVAVQEILVNNPAIGNLVREDKQSQIYAQMQLNQAVTGMQTQAQLLIGLVNEGKISQEDAISYASNTDEVKKALGLKVN